MRRLSPSAAKPADPRVRNRYVRSVDAIYAKACAVPQDRFLLPEQMLALLRWALLCESICPKIMRDNRRAARELHSLLGIDFLRGAGIEPLYRTYPMPPGFNVDQINLMGDWLQSSREPRRFMTEAGCGECASLRLTAGHENSLWLTVSMMAGLPSEWAANQWAFRGICSGYLWRDIDFFINKWQAGAGSSALMKDHGRKLRALRTRLKREQGTNIDGWIPCPETAAAIEKALDVRLAASKRAKR